MGISTELLGLIGAAGQPGITLAALDEQVPQSKKAIVMAAGVLAERGLLERPAPGLYRLTPAGRIALANGAEIKGGPRRTHLTAVQENSLRARLWRAMRAMNKFGLDDLLLRAATGTEGDAANNAIKYVNVLERAGYLLRLRQRLPGEAPTSPGFPRWILLRNSGPRPPVWRKRHAEILDPNTGKTYPLAPPAREVAHV